MNHKLSTLALILFIGVISIAAMASSTDSGLWTNEIVTNSVSLTNTSKNVCIGNICWTGWQLSIQNNASINGSPICTQANGYCAGQPAQGNGTANYLAEWINGSYLKASTLTTNKVSTNLHNHNQALNTTSNVLFSSANATQMNIQSADATIIDTLYVKNNWGVGDLHTIHAESVGTNDAILSNATGAGVGVYGYSVSGLGGKFESQNSAGLRVSGGSSATAAIIQGRSGQTGDLLVFQNSSNDKISFFDKDGFIGVGENAIPSDVYPLYINNSLNNGVGVHVTNQEGTSAISSYTMSSGDYLAVFGLTSDSYTDVAQYNDSLFIFTGPRVDNGISFVTQNESAPIRFATGGLAKSDIQMIIDSDGNVGIGTTTPSSPLQISSVGGFATGLTIKTTSTGGYGAIDFINNADAIVGQFLASDTAFTSGSFLPNELALASELSSGGLHLAAIAGDGVIHFTSGGNTAANERMRILADGDVGIGITNPTYDLDLYRDNEPSILYLNGAPGRIIMNSQNLDSGARPSIKILNNNAFVFEGDDHADMVFSFASALAVNRSYDAVFRMYGSGTGWTQYMDFFHDGSNGEFLTGSGNITINPASLVDVQGDLIVMNDQIGIGTSNPTSTLHINHNTAADIKLQESATDNLVKGSIYFIGGSNTMGLIEGYRDAFNEGDLIFSIRTGNAVKEKARLNGDGLFFTQIYGEMYLHNETNAATTLNAANTYANVTESMQTGTLNGFTYSNGKLTTLHNGNYSITIDGSFSGTASQEYHITLGINGQAQEDCHIARVIGSGGDVGAASTSCIKSILVNDELTIMVENKDSAGDPTFTDASMTLLRIGE